MKAFTYTDKKIKNEIDITAIPHDDSFDCDVIKTCAFRTYAPVDWNADSLSAALTGKSNKELLLSMYVELTNAHEPEGTSFLPKDCFLLAVPLTEKPVITDTHTIPLMSTGEYALYICYEGSTQIRVLDKVIENHKGKPVVSTYTETATKPNTSGVFHVFDF